MIALQARGAAHRDRGIEVEVGLTQEALPAGLGRREPSFLARLVRALACTDRAVVRDQCAFLGPLRGPLVVDHMPIVPRSDGVVNG